MNFSFCLIVKNEGKKLDKCLSPIKNLGQEIVIVDTGSTDNTIDIAKNYTDSIYHFDWINDFSAARNFAMEKAKNNFVFFLDADEYTEDYDFKYLQKMINAYPSAIGQITRRNRCMSKDDDEIIYVDLVERLFDKRLYLYTGAIHEQVTSRTNAQLVAYEMNWTVFHDGYIGTPEELKAKGMRNANLLLKDLEKDPSDPYTYYQLGQSYELFNDYDNAYKYYKKGAELASDYSLKYIEIMVINYGNVLINKKMYSEALQLDNSTFETYKSNADFVYMLANAARESGNLVKAIDYYKAALACKKYDTEGMNSFYPWHNLGCIYEAFDNYQDALTAFNNASKFKKANERYNNLKAKLTDYQNRQKKISIITICNKADNISIYLNALSNQTIGICNLELIFIDNTNDNKMFSILEAFENEHSENVILMKNTDNLNEEALYATGFSYSSGEYILFTNDDLIPIPDCFRLLYAGAKSINSDFVKSKYIDIDANNTDLLSKIEELSELSININTFAIDFLEGNNKDQIKKMRLLSEPLTGILYNCDFIINNNITFSFENTHGILPFENDVYNNAHYSFIIESICFIRIS